MVSEDWSLDMFTGLDRIRGHLREDCNLFVKNDLVSG